MFEDNKPVSRARKGAQCEDTRASDGVQPRSDRAGAGADIHGRRSQRGGDALRSIEWSELTARLNAARELRRELRDEAILCAGTSGARFGDAAGGLYSGLAAGRQSDGERRVNRDDLESRKASGGKRVYHMGANQSGDAPEGDARDET